MKVMGHNIPFYTCSWFRSQEPQNIARYILEATNAAERQQRLQWLWEGSLMYHMEKKDVTPDGCPIEKAMFGRLIAFLADTNHQRRR